MTVFSAESDIRVSLSPGHSFYGLVQIAGIHDPAEADLLLSAGVDALGFPLRLPVHAEDCTEDAARDMAAAIRSRATPVCICYLDRADDIRAFCAGLEMRHVQLHGPVPEPELARLRRIAPDLFIIKSLVLPVTATISPLPALVAQVQRDAPHVDAFITDTHDPATGANGATGKPHDWTFSAHLVGISPRPVILAGGLTADTVRKAIFTVRPAGVDVHTGVEGSDGRKDRNRVLLFIRQAKQAFAEISALRS